MPGRVNPAEAELEWGLDVGETGSSVGTKTWCYRIGTGAGTHEESRLQL
jgi:hypothetical protein